MKNLNFYNLLCIACISILSSCSKSSYVSCPTFKKQYSNEAITYKHKIKSKKEGSQKVEAHQQIITPSKSVAAQAIATIDALKATPITNELTIPAVNNTPLITASIKTDLASSLQAPIEVKSKTNLLLTQKENTAQIEETKNTNKSTASSTSNLKLANVLKASSNLSFKEKIAFIKAAKNIKKELNKNDTDAETKGKSQLTALLLAIFVGGLGIHRFYLGYTTIGIIQLLTLGGCGIWALIDLIRIATGDLKPFNGEYTEKI